MRFAITARLALGVGLLSAACTPEEEATVDLCPGSCLAMEGVYTMTGSCPPTYCTILQDDCSVQLSCDDGTAATTTIVGGQVDSVSVRNVHCSATLSQDGFTGQCTGTDFQCSFQASRPLERACLGSEHIPAEAPETVSDCTQAELDAGTAGCDCLRATRFDRTYLFCPQSATWSEAQAACRARGGDLVTVNDGDEQAFLAAVGEPLDVTRAWIGATDAGFEGRFTWSDGSPWRGLPWAEGEPNNELDGSETGEDCVHFTDALSFNDLECDAYMSFICEGSGTLAK